MKIKKFKGIGIRGYMDFDISFNDGISFLIGINGSGKTTVLKLISGLITPSFIELFQIEFNSIELIVEIVENQKSKTNCIRCEKGKTKLTLSLNDKKTEIPILTQKYGDNFPSEFVLDRMRNEMMHFEEDSVVKKIKELKTPLFLGLNRRTIGHIIIPNIERFPNRKRTSNMDLLLEQDYVDKALNDIQDLFNNAILNNTQNQYQLHNRFRTKVFGESFTISEIPTNVDDLNYSMEMKRLEKREQDYNNAMEMLGLNDIEKKSKKFFERIKSILSTLENTSSLDSDNKLDVNHYNALLNWILNKEQLNRTDRIIKYANEYSDSIQKLKKPFTRFADSVNIFFSEGKKQIKVEDSGEIKVIILDNKKKTNTIYELSSGEKQLIIILAHVAFYKEISQNSAPIFIIDEPELSLHISWQEKFVDALLQANPDTQFIMATHAPSIIAKANRKKWCIDLTK